MKCRPARTAARASVAYNVMRLLHVPSSALICKVSWLGLPCYEKASQRRPVWAPFENDRAALKCHLRQIRIHRGSWSLAGGLPLLMVNCPSHRIYYMYSISPIRPQKGFENTLRIVIKRKPPYLGNIARCIVLRVTCR
jgi:hypothetical protein